MSESARSTTSRFCEACGHQFGEGARFCGGCGTATATDAGRRNETPSGRSIAPNVVFGVLAAAFILLSVVAQENQRKAATRFIDRHFYDPVRAINLRNTIPEFYGRVYRRCTPATINFQTGEYRPVSCPSNHPFVMLFRVPGAIAGTAGYVLSQGPVAMAIVGMSALVFVGLMLKTSWEEQSFGWIVNPWSWLLLGLVAFPLFTGLLALAVQLLILIVLLMIKSLIAALAFLGIAYLLFEKFKLWDETRRALARGMATLTRKDQPRRKLG